MSQKHKCIFADRGQFKCYSIFCGQLFLLVRRSSYKNNVCPLVDQIEIRLVCGIELNASCGLWLINSRQPVNQNFAKWNGSGCSVHFWVGVQCKRGRCWQKQAADEEQAQQAWQRKKYFYLFFQIYSLQIGRTDYPAESQRTWQQGEQQSDKFHGCAVGNIVFQRFENGCGPKHEDGEKKPGKAAEIGSRSLYAPIGDKPDKRSKKGNGKNCDQLQWPFSWHALGFHIPIDKEEHRDDRYIEQCEHPKTGITPRCRFHEFTGMLDQYPATN